MNEVKKWITIVEYVSLHTGEIITKSEFERDYYKVRSSKKIEIKEELIKNEKIKIGYVRYTTECRINGQKKLF